MKTDEGSNATSPGRSPACSDTMMAGLEEAYRRFGLSAEHARSAALADCASAVPQSLVRSETKVVTDQAVRADDVPRALVIAAFAAVYLIWGSTYLGIRFAIETVPPFLMAGHRFLLAGLFLYAVARLRGAAAPGTAECRDASVVGVLLLFMGNGGVTWSEQFVPSSIASLIVALVPLWIVTIDWLRPKGVRPVAITFGGLALGFAGIASIVAATRHDGERLAAPAGLAVLMVASLSWAGGSVFSRHARKPASPLLMVGLQMIAGGLALLAAGSAANELDRFDWGAVSRKSLLAWIYLTAAGSVIGYTSYVWLLQVSTPARVATYAYVNPVIAVTLGCTLGGETLSPLMFLGAALVIAAVVLILRAPTRPVKPAPTRIGRV